MDLLNFDIIKTITHISRGFCVSSNQETNNLLRKCSSIALCDNQTTLFNRYNLAKLNNVEIKDNMPC